MSSTGTRKQNLMEQATVKFTGLGKKPNDFVYLQMVHVPVSSIDIFPKILENSGVY